MAEQWDVVVVGGGFYGLYLAEFLASRFARVLLCEQGPGLMRRASYSNQARVHNGYHYPRSILTAVRSRVNFPRFVAEFAPAVSAAFEKVYAIASLGSKVTAEQFVESMQRIGAPIEVADKAVKGLFNPSLIEEVFRVREYAFDSVKLMQLMSTRISRAGVEVQLNTAVDRIWPEGGAEIRARLCTPNGEREVHSGMVLCCAYGQTNLIAAASGLPVIPLKHELTEMALIEVPDALRGLGVTVMDGAFFSCMPFPPRGLHTLSHVRYTPHGHWSDRAGEEFIPAYEVHAAAEKRTAFPHMIRDAAKFLPALAGSEYRDSLWEVKTVLPRSETDDSRPILFRADHGIPNFHIVMGGKIDNVYDVCEEIAVRFGWPRAAQG